MKKSYHVTILLLNWNGFSLTKTCMTSLLKDPYPNFSFLLGDNGSDNNEADRLIEEFKKTKYKSFVKKHPIIVKKFKKNYGYAIGMNKLFQFVKSEFVLIINNDMKFDSSFITELVNVLSSNKQIGICQPKLLHMNKKRLFDYSVAAGGYIDYFGYPFARGRIFTDIEKDYGQYDSIAKISWCGIFMARRNVLKKTGLFDPIFINYGEDMDLCYRVYGIGFVIVNVPTSIGYHISGATLKRNLFKKMYYHHRNNLIVNLKNFDDGWLLKTIFIRIIFDWISAIYYLYRGTFKSSLAVFVAHLDVLFLLPTIFKARKQSQKLIQPRHIKNMPMYKGSIVMMYFLFKKKHFSDISIENSTL